MGRNAVLVSDRIEAVEIDFSTFDSIVESSGFKRPYTIHSPTTIALSNRLGFHVGGFCDDRGGGGPDLAAEIAGYDYLPSNLILCKMDFSYNFLPLSEDEVDAVIKGLRG
ncbi:MAG: hypothetical protein K6B65_03450 [Bacilli bacterium]|nr:hypothetical protein [Bacilli bacterium]